MALWITILQMWIAVTQFQLPTLFHKSVICCHILPTANAVICLQIPITHLQSSTLLTNVLVTTLPIDNVENCWQTHCQSSRLFYECANHFQGNVNFQHCAVHQIFQCNKEDKEKMLKTFPNCKETYPWFVFLSCLIYSLVTKKMIRFVLNNTKTLIVLLQMEVTWHKIRLTGEQRNVPESKKKPLITREVGFFFVRISQRSLITFYCSPE